MYIYIEEMISRLGTRLYPFPFPTVSLPVYVKQSQGVRATPRVRRRKGTVPRTDERGDTGREFERKTQKGREQSKQQTNTQADTSVWRQERFELLEGEIHFCQHKPSTIDALFRSTSFWCCFLLVGFLGLQLSHSSTQIAVHAFMLPHIKQQLDLFLNINRNILYI